jgi:hypothetical protein
MSFIPNKLRLPRERTQLMMQPTPKAAMFGSERLE